MDLDKSSRPYITRAIISASTFEITENWIKKFLNTPRATPRLLERLLRHESSFKATHKLLDWALKTEIEPEITIVSF